MKQITSILFALIIFFLSMPVSSAVMKKDCSQIDGMIFCRFADGSTAIHCNGPDFYTFDNGFLEINACKEQITQYLETKSYYTYIYKTECRYTDNQYTEYCQDVYKKYKFFKSLY